MSILGLHVWQVHMAPQNHSILSLSMVGWMKKNGRPSCRMSGTGHYQHARRNATRWNYSESTGTAFGLFSYAWRGSLVQTSSKLYYPAFPENSRSLLKNHLNFWLSVVKMSICRSLSFATIFSHFTLFCSLTWSTKTQSAASASLSCRDDPRATGNSLIHTRIASLAIQRWTAERRKLQCL